MAQTSFTIIETRRSSSGQKNTPVITGATINSPMARTSRLSRLRLQNDMRNQDCSPRHWMVGYNAKRRKDEVRICTCASHLSFLSWLLVKIGSTYSEPAPGQSEYGETWKSAVAGRTGKGYRQKEYRRRSVAWTCGPESSRRGGPILYGR